VYKTPAGQERTGRTYGGPRKVWLSPPTEENTKQNPAWLAANRLSKGKIRDSNPEPKTVAQGPRPAQELRMFWFVFCIFKRL
jgi:hypothetical protein